MVRKLLFGVFGVLSFTASLANNLPSGFVYLKDVDPSILQDIRYSTYHNFVGRPIQGYEAAECILTKPAAKALHKVQEELLKSNLSLKVYDCYRPQMAVDDFIAWSAVKGDQITKAEFYPQVDKADLFKLGYVAAKSSHSRGSTMDLTIVPIPTLQEATYHRGQKLVSCYAAYHDRFQDNSIDMGTGFDCMDERAHPDNIMVGVVAYQHRMILQQLMLKYGFNPYPYEWWHFTLKDEPYPNTYFNFPITAEE